MARCLSKREETATKRSSILDDMWRVENVAIGLVLFEWPGRNMEGQSFSSDELDLLLVHDKVLNVQNNNVDFGNLDQSTEEQSLLQEARTIPITIVIRKVKVNDTTSTREGRQILPVEVEALVLKERGLWEGRALDLE